MFMVYKISFCVLIVVCGVQVAPHNQ